MIVYVFLINALSFIVMGYDKKKAELGGWRVPEKRLLFLAGIGGAAGVYFGMLYFRHKTRHLFFSYSVLILILLNLLTFYFLGKSLWMGRG